MVTALVPETFFPLLLVYMAWITDFKLDFEISSNRTINLIQFIISCLMAGIKGIL